MPTIPTSQFLYADPNNPNFYRGTVVVLNGSATIDLGIGHNNFIPSVQVKGGIAALAPAHIVACDYGPRPGTLVITVGKATSASVTTVIAATVPVTVFFIAIAQSSVVA